MEMLTVISGLNIDGEPVQAKRRGVSDGIDCRRRGVKVEPELIPGEKLGGRRAATEAACFCLQPSGSAFCHVTLTPRVCVQVNVAHLHPQQLCALLVLFSILFQWPSQCGCRCWQCFLDTGHLPAACTPDSLWRGRHRFDSPVHYPSMH